MSVNLARRNGYLVDPFFNLFFDSNAADGRHGSLSMKTDIIEKEKEYVLNIELAGFNKKDINISLKDGYLFVEASRNTFEEKEEKDSFVMRERFSGSASKSFYVGDVSESDINASFENGLLSISIPKEADREEKTHKIEIK